MRVIVAVPTAGVVAPECFKSIYDLDVSGHEVEFQPFRGYCIDHVRTSMADKAVKGGFDAVLMVDSDIELPHDALVCLSSHGVGVCLGHYQRRSGEPGVTCLFRKGAKYDRPFTADELRAFRESGDNLFEVRGGGLGCAFITTDVLERVGKPWFDYVMYADGTKLSEDLFFCSRCRETGVSIYADARVSCGHVMATMHRAL